MKCGRRCENNRNLRIVHFSHIIYSFSQSDRFGFCKALAIHIRSSSPLMMLIQGKSFFPVPFSTPAPHSCHKVAKVILQPFVFPRIQENRNRILNCSFLTIPRPCLCHRAKLWACFFLSRPCFANAPVLYSFFASPLSFLCRLFSALYTRAYILYSVYIVFFVCFCLFFCCVCKKVHFFLRFVLCCLKMSYLCTRFAQKVA